MDDPDQLIVTRQLREARRSHPYDVRIRPLRASHPEESGPSSLEETELARLQDANMRLQARVRELETQLARHHVLSDDQLIAELPGRTARVLESAIDAANEIITRAKEKAQRLEQEARHRADGLLIRADERATALYRQAEYRAHELIRTSEDEYRRMLARITRERTALEDDLAARRAAVEAEVAELHRQLVGLRRAQDTAVQTIEAMVRRLRTEGPLAGVAAGPVTDGAAPGDALRLAPVSTVREAAVEGVAGGQADSTTDDDARALETPIDMLFVCTHNLFRSPVAAKLLSSRVAELSIPARVRSAGMEPAKHSMPSALKAMLKDHDIDIERHRCKVLSPQALETADLVLAMSHEHVLAIHRNAPAHRHRTFTLKEFVRHGEQIGPRRSAETWPQWLDRVNAQRGEPAALDDLMDPNGQSRLYYQQLVEELESLIDRLVAVLWKPDTNWGAQSGQTLGRAPDDSRSHRVPSLHRLWDRGVKD